MKIDYSRLPSACSCIIIDGDPGSGKTTLAGKIANDLGFKVTSFDDAKYLPGDGGPYLEQLNYEALRIDILASAPKIIIEGVCALKVLAKINVRHDYHIFIERDDGSIGWPFGQYLDPNAKPPHDKFWQEIVQYYREYKPFDACDLLL